MQPAILVVATGNSGKLREYESILAGLPVELRSLGDYPGVVAAEEVGETFEANAKLKALAAAEATGQWALADDSGLCVDALGGAPGVYSARFGGPGKSDRDRCLALLEALEGAKAGSRRAVFVCVIAVAGPAGEVETLQGRCEGRLLSELCGGGGFGYDPLFVPDGQQLSFAELPEKVKNRLSHRGAAAGSLADLLVALLSLRPSTGSGK